MIKEEGEGLECQDSGDVAVAAIFAPSHNHLCLFKKSSAPSRIGYSAVGVSMFASLDIKDCSKLKWRPP